MIRRGDRHWYQIILANAYICTRNISECMSMNLVISLSIMLTGIMKTYINDNYDVLRMFDFRLFICTAQ